MGDEADADWQEGLIEMGIENATPEWPVNTYQCYCPDDKKAPTVEVDAETSFEARKFYARQYQKQASECVALLKHKARS